MAEKIPVYIMGKQYFVPEGLTIMSALEYSGYKLIRGCGCRGGFCGACGTVYRLPKDYQIHVGLACQTPVEKDMVLTTLPFFPARNPDYSIEDMIGKGDELLEIYPEVKKCIGCNSCTKICPQDLEVMRIMQKVGKGDIPATAQLSFDCIMCGLCASRCPAGIAPYNVFILARRLYGRYHLSVPSYLGERQEEIEQGKYKDEIKKMMALKPEKLKECYALREMEKL